MNRPPASEYEADILRAIACGITASELQRMDPWSVEDVARTMQRHGLAVTAGGSIVRADVPLPKTLELAAYSPNPRVQQQAVRARAQLTKLAEVLAMDHARQNANNLRRFQRASLQAWIDQLQQMETEARGELRRLKEASPRSRKAVDERQVRKEAS